MIFFYSVVGGWSLRGVVAYVLYRDILVSEFELKSLYYVHFWTNSHGKGITPLIPSSYVLNSTTAVFYKNGFGIK